MEFVYVMINDNDWEDMIIYLSEKEAIDISNKYPHIRIEIFSKKTDSDGYSPTYNYYKGGKLYQSSNKNGYGEKQNP
jgi:DNA repair photolyase